MLGSFSGGGENNVTNWLLVGIVVALIVCAFLLFKVNANLGDLSDSAIPTQMIRTVIQP